MVKKINLRHSQNNLFKVEFLPWPAIEDLLYQFSEVREFIYGPIESSALAKLETQNRSIYAAVEALSAGPTPTEVDAELDNCKALLEAHRHEEAKTFLLRLEQRSWDKLSPRQKFRLKANLGATKLAAGKFEEAARLYLESRTYQPDDPKAQVNEALGHLLTGNIDRAFELSSQIRRDFPSEALANIVWVNSAPQSLSLTAILAELPSYLFAHVDLFIVDLDEMESGSLLLFIGNNEMIFYNAEVTVIFTVCYAMDAAQKHTDGRVPDIQGQREDTWTSLYRFFRVRRWKHTP